jgi:predicted HTH transcriptional regulator
MRGLFDLLAKGDRSSIRALLGRQEQVDFDCKRKANLAHGRIEPSDKQNLGKILSAFSNSMGGLLLWGVDARKDSSGFDVVFGFDPISNISRFAEDIRTACVKVLMPRLEHVGIAVIEENGGTDVGYLALFINRSERRPHRCEVGNA